MNAEEPFIRVDEFGRILAVCPKCREHHTLPGQGEEGGFWIPTDAEIPRMGRDRLIKTIQGLRWMPSKLNELADTLESIADGSSDYLLAGAILDEAKALRAMRYELEGK